jgi:hypothetical protein
MEVFEEFDFILLFFTVKPAACNVDFPRIEPVCKFGREKQPRKDVGDKRRSLQTLFLAGTARRAVRAASSGAMNVVGCCMAGPFRALLRAVTARAPSLPAISLAHK